jgi:hypothetical protein
MLVLGNAMRKNVERVLVVDDSADSDEVVL